MRIKVAAIAGIFALSMIGVSTADARGNKVVRQIPVTDKFLEFDISWNRTGPSYYAKILVTVNKGMIEVCGAGVFVNAQMRTATNSVLRKHWVKVNGKQIFSDFRFFNKVNRRRKLDKAIANCASTGVRAPGKRFQYSYGGGGGRYRTD